MTIIHALIFGIVEGFTEFLPVSSTAHLILTAEMLHLDQSAFVKSFEITIQSAAIFAVIFFYWRKFLDKAILKRILAAFIPTALIGFILYKFIKQFLIGNISLVLWVLALGGAVLIILEKYVFKKNGSDGLIENDKKSIENLTYKQAAIIGLAQAIAVVPGVSRSAATIVGGLAMGMSRKAVVEFSFLLAVPTILAATFYDLYKSINVFSTDQSGVLAVGFVTSFVTAALGIKFLLNYVQKKTFVEFGIYRIFIVIIFIFLTSYVK